MMKFVYGNSSINPDENISWRDLIADYLRSLNKRNHFSLSLTPLPSPLSLSFCLHTCTSSLTQEKKGVLLFEVFVLVVVEAKGTSLAHDDPALTWYLDKPLQGWLHEEKMKERFTHIQKLSRVGANTILQKQSHNPSCNSVRETLTAKTYVELAHFFFCFGKQDLSEVFLTWWTQTKTKEWFL